MPVWIPGKFDMGRNIFTEVKGVATYNGDPAFDSTLKISPNPATNHTLKLNLRIFLDKFVPPLNAKSWPYLDANHNLFIVGPWNHVEWHHFVNNFKKQCDMWNDNFWLVPPADFSALDVKIGAKTLRANVHCALNVEIVLSSPGAHRSIHVVNLDAKSAARIKGTTESQIDGGDFNSDENTYDVLDAFPHNVPLHDPSGTVKYVRHYTIAHEIGHALGEEHIGVIRNVPLCRMAILFDTAVHNGFPAAAVPAMMNQGSDSQVCYGDFSSTHDSANIMGGGGEFATDNAGPWIDQMARHLTKPTAWTVSTNRVAPRWL